MRTPLLAVWVVLSAAGLAIADGPTPRMADLLAPGAKVEKIQGGFGFLEGTVWVGDHLIFSDEGDGRDTLFRYDDRGGVSVFRHPCRSTNGNTLDRQGRLLSCEQDARAVVRAEADGTLTTLVDRYDGHRFNSPNDVVVKSDDSVWFTDPSYGLPKGQPRELPGCYVFRFDPATKAVTAVVTDMRMPNGLAFSPDEKTLYVSDTDRARHIRAFDVHADGTLGPGRELCKLDKGAPDGFRVDADGRIWTSAGDGVQVFAPDGKLIGKVPVPESPANVCFGGPAGHTLFIAARTGLYRVETTVTGAKRN